ncbi:hypothetical protein [Anoxybacillus gonensis]|uniref:hypothetical protein n=1 Tax=Anoxybacillus gonensis TaxID=198467 RepID=UPI0002BFA5D1|nr:hypothetical protein [Anoxybacillus gonensis]EMI09230.1 hypothetical protein F510_2635 [Anoxybacillus gonensis]
MTTKTTKKMFQIQIADRIIRSPKIDSTAFVLYGKLIQLYRLKGGVSDTIEIDHAALKYFLNIKSNQKLKSALNALYSAKLIKTKIDALPKNQPLRIEINSFFDLKKAGKTKEDRFTYTQMPYILLERSMIEKIGHAGVRLLYYFESYINRTKEFTKQFCFTSLVTIQKEIGLTENTILKYVDILKKNKLISVTKHKFEFAGYDDLDNVVFTKYNNHYYVHIENIHTLYEEIK